LIKHRLMLSAAAAALLTAAVTAANADVTIAEIARRWKFSRPGDFATRYKALFGRYPSETRRSWQTEKNLLKVEESRQPPLCAIAE